MRAFVALLAFICVALVSSADAAWPSARWRRPVGDGPNGDVRPLMKQLHKQNPPSKADPFPKTHPDPSSKSRSYHFKYGPIFPEHHIHLKESGAFWPPQHKLYYP